MNNLEEILKDKDTFIFDFNIAIMFKFQQDFNQSMIHKQFNKSGQIIIDNMEYFNMTILIIGLIINLLILQIINSRSQQTQHQLQYLQLNYLLTGLS